MFNFFDEFLEINIFQVTDCSSKLVNNIFISGKKYSTIWIFNLSKVIQTADRRGSELRGSVCTGIGCQGMLAFHICRPLGGKRAERSTWALCKQRSTSLLWTWTSLLMYVLFKKLLLSMYRFLRNAPSSYACCIPRKMKKELALFLVSPPAIVRHW